METERRQLKAKVAMVEEFLSFRRHQDLIDLPFLFCFSPCKRGWGLLAPVLWVISVGCNY